MVKIILFDGVCNFCDKSVQFIIKRDNKEHFKFSSLQSDKAKQLMKKCKVPENINSFVLIEDHIYYVKSSAALRVCKDLNGAWKVLYLLLIVPTPIRDFFYDFIAKNRYKWFGRKDSCMLPTIEERNRFL